MRIYSSGLRVDRYAGDDEEARSAGAHLGGRLGALLVSSGVMSVEQAEQVARAQRGTGRRFGEAAVALGLATQADIDTALARQFNFAIDAQPGSQLHPSLITARGRRDRASELVRSLRANLSHVLDDWPESERPAVTIASLTGAVGRRLITGNLAIAATQAGLRTLLIDADLRQPMLNSLFNTADDAGLSTFLAGRQPRPRINRIAAISGLSFMPAGPVPPNPAELLAKLAGAMPALRAAAEADLILVNPPPLDVAEDVFSIATAAPAVVIVARRHFTRANQLTAAAARLKLVGATVIGSVLNVA